MADLEGQTFAGFKVISKIGQGGAGVVYKARQPVLDRLVALKILPTQLAAEPAFVARFKREAAAAAGLSHTGIVQVFSAGEHEGACYIAMELVEGETLQQRLDRHGRLQPREALAVCVYVAEALKYAWDKARLIHRDIKPENIYLSDKGEVKLGDLGLAKRAGSEATRLTQHGTTWGTPHYMSPEQARGDSDLDLRSDIYSLGCTLYHTLTGQTPYQGADVMAVMTKQVHDPPPAILKALPTCPMPLVLLLNKMLAKHPSARPQTYDELIAELQKTHDQLITMPATAVEGPPPETPATPKAAGPKKPSWLIYAAAGAAAVAGAAVALLVWAPWKHRGVPAATAGAPPAKALTPATEAAPETPPSVAPQAPPMTQAVAAATAGNVPALAPVAAPPAPSTNMPPAAPGPTPVDAAFIAAVAALPPDEQVARVVAKLKELNPAFDGRETHRVEDGKVIELSFSSAGVTDITPLEGLPALQSLTCSGTIGNQSLADLAPLRGMALTKLDCQLTKVRSLAPLAGMPLATLLCRNTPLTSLAALKELPLKELDCDFQPERDRDVLWSIKSLERINGQPAADFWEAVGAPEDPFVLAVAALSATQQIARVTARLKELNPQFDGRVGHKMAQGRVVELSFSTAAVRDILPVRALRGLHRLVMVPPGGTNAPGVLEDLSPLKGLPLSGLWCQNNPIASLKPLRGMPLSMLSCGRTRVSDLAPLKGMPLTVLSCDHTAVSDLSPLAGAPLTVLWCNNTKVSDLSPLAGMPLRELRCDFDPARDAKALRGIRTLQKINDQLAAMFWMQLSVPAAKAAAKAAVKTARTPLAVAPEPAAAAGKQMLDRFVAQMKELNAGFDGQVQPEFEAGRLVGVAFSSLAVTNLAPVRELTGLKRLRCVGPAEGLGKVADLMPLAGLPLLDLDCQANQIVDLSPLKATTLKSLALDLNPVSDLRAVKGLRLTSFSANGTKVADLTPLQGMPLTALSVRGVPVGDLSPVRSARLIRLNADNTRISDLGALRGMPLESLSCANTAVRDLSPLKEMPLTFLDITGTPVSDLLPLRELPLTTLFCGGTKVTSLLTLREMPLAVLGCAHTTISDLLPLRDKALTVLHIHDTEVADLTVLRRMPLTEVYVHNTKVTDLSPLKDSPLRALRADIKLPRDSVVLRQLRTLETVNGLPVAEFWKKAAGAP